MWKHELCISNTTIPLLVPLYNFLFLAFDRFDPRLDGQDAERKFMWKSATPYISFFIVLLVTVAVLPLCDKLWIPCSEMSLVALFFTGNNFVNIHLLQQNLIS